MRIGLRAKNWGGAVMRQILSLDLAMTKGDGWLAEALKHLDENEEDGEHLRMINTLQAIMRSDLLTDRQRAALKMRYYDGMSGDEIAQKMGINASTVSKHLKKARMTIQAIMCLSFPRLRNAEAAQNSGKKSEFTFLGLTTGGKI